MARAQSPAEALLTDVLARAVTPPLKAAGFRKSGMNYHRRRGEAVQVVNVQVSHGSSRAEKQFSINAGVAFDAIAVPLLVRPVPPRPGERAGHVPVRGHGRGLALDCGSFCWASFVGQAVP